MFNHFIQATYQAKSTEIKIGNNAFTSPNQHFSYLCTSNILAGGLTEHGNGDYLRLRLMVEAHANPLAALPGLHHSGLVFLISARGILGLQLLIQHMGQIQQVVRVSLSIGLLGFA